MAWTRPVVLAADDVAWFWAMVAQAALCAEFWRVYTDLVDSGDGDETVRWGDLFPSLFYPTDAEALRATGFRFLMGE